MAHGSRLGSFQSRIWLDGTWPVFTGPNEDSGAMGPRQPSAHCGTQAALCRAKQLYKEFVKRLYHHSFKGWTVIRPGHSKHHPCLSFSCVDTDIKQSFACLVYIPMYPCKSMHKLAYHCMSKDTKKGMYQCFFAFIYMPLRMLVAERVGFEPTCPISRTTRFRVGRVTANFATSPH